MTRWWVGGYGPDMDGTAAGIGLLDSAPDGSLSWSSLAAQADSPTFLGVCDGALVAAEESTGHVVSFAVDGAALTFESRTPSGGAAPCQIGSIGGALTVANYLDGVIGVITGAELTQALHPEPGTGPLTFQDGPHAHATYAVDPKTLLTLDLGADRIDIHELADGRLRTIGSLIVSSGTGPRDIARHPSGLLYVLGELGGTVLVLRWADGVLAVVASVAVPGFVERDHAAAIAFGPNGYLYVGLRGSNRVGVLRASDDGALEPIGFVSCEGDWPRHLATDGDLLHVANQRSNTVSSFRLGSDGMPRLIATAAVPSPTYLLAVG